MGDLVSHMVQRVTTCGDYSKALNIISEYVETELSPPAIPQKSNKKKARNTHERGRLMNKAAQPIGNIVGQPRASELLMGLDAPYGQSAHVQLHTKSHERCETDQRR